MGDANVNGDVPQSQTLSHLASYPAVNSGIETFKSNPYGAKSVELATAAYDRAVKPTLPYLEKPSAYVKPYAVKADEIGDKILTKVEEQLPILKQETGEIKQSISDFVFWPLAKGAETKDWVFRVYGSEYDKCGGNGYVATGKAICTTPLILASESLAWISSFLQTKGQEAKEVVAEKTNN